MSDAEISQLVGSQHSLEKFFAFLRLHIRFRCAISAHHIFLREARGGVFLSCSFVHLLPE